MGSLTSYEGDATVAEYKARLDASVNVDPDGVAAHLQTLRRQADVFDSHARAFAATLSTMTFT